MIRVERSLGSDKNAGTSGSTRIHNQFADASNMVHQQPHAAMRGEFLINKEDIGCLHAPS